MSAVWFTKQNHDTAALIVKRNEQTSLINEGI
jgi:hypothetical protein